MRQAVVAVWQYRHFVRTGIQSELALRFARSRLGATWSILHPLTQSAIYAIVLSEVLGAKLPNVTSKSAYPVYLLAGTAAWSLFNEIVNRSLTMFIDHSAVLKKVSFPRLCLPVIVLGSTLLNHAFLLLAIALVTACLGMHVGVGWLYLPLGVLVISMLAFAIGVFAGVLNVVCRDVGQVLLIVMQIWFWLTPIVYPIGAIPDGLRWLIHANPMVPLVRIYQDALLWQIPPDPLSLLPSIALAALGGIAALCLFRRASVELVDAL